jgi:hypothetical protein
MFFKKKVYEIDKDDITSSEAKGLANNELGEYEFIVAIIIWYELLYVVNLVSKHLQTKDILIDIAIEKVQGMISFFKESCTISGLRNSSSQPGALGRPPPPWRVLPALFSFFCFGLAAACERCLLVYFPQCVSSC